MPIFNEAPLHYMVLKDVLKQLGMSRQNFYQSGLADFMQVEYVIYKVGKTYLYYQDDVDEMKAYLTYRTAAIKRGEIAASHPLVDAALWEHATGNSSETLDREMGL